MQPAAAAQQIGKYILRLAERFTCCRYSLMLTNSSTTPRVPLARPAGTLRFHSRTTCDTHAHCTAHLCLHQPSDIHSSATWHRCTCTTGWARQHSTQHFDIASGSDLTSACERMSLGFRVRQRPQPMHQRLRPELQHLLCKKLYGSRGFRLLQCLRRRHRPTCACGLSFSCCWAFVKPSSSCATRAADSRPGSGSATLSASARRHRSMQHSLSSGPGSCA